MSKFASYGSSEKLDITKSMIFGSMRREFYLEHYDPQRWVVEESGRIDGKFNS